LGGASVSPRQPLAQQLNGLVGSLPVKGHQCGWNARRLDDAGAPAVRFDRGDLKQVRTAGNAFFKTANSNIHGIALGDSLCWGTGTNSTLRTQTIKRSAVRKQRPHARGTQIAPETTQKKFCCPEIHRKCTLHPQLFHSLTRPVRARTLEPSMKACRSAGALL